jgi:serine/threonine protein phosphatase 1
VAQAPATGPARLPGRLLVVGDIHGCDVALQRLLEHVKVAPGDTFVQIGDVIDRGPATQQVIERLLELRTRCRFIFVLGNHEELFLDALDTGNPRHRTAWLESGGRAALQSYGADAETLPPDHVSFLRTGCDYFVAGGTVFVHANLEPGRPLAEQSPEWLRWVKLTRRERPVPGFQRVICGHTPQSSGLPWVGDGWVCIDTWAYGGLYLTCLDVTSDLVYQASESGEFRGPVPLSECEAVWGPRGDG